MDFFKKKKKKHMNTTQTHTHSLTPAEGDVKICFWK